MIEKEILHYIVVKDPKSGVYFINLYERGRAATPIFQTMANQMEVTKILKDYATKGYIADHIDI